jgi:oligopeptide/dipeptide ABC transporter ATP-binding protein
MDNKNQKPWLEVNNLTQEFIQSRGFFKTTSVIKAVDNVSFIINKGETLGLVGESGCGKSSLGRSILRLIEPTSGSVYLMGENVTKASKNRLRQLRQHMQIIFQDPYASLNPRMNVQEIIEEPLLIHKFLPSKKERQNRVTELMDLVGLRADLKSRYPHEFSGGQRQRIGIARALAVNPSLIICDEPVSALDVSIQAQIINLMQDLQYHLGLTYLFIAHDLHVVRHIASRIAVMYLGNIVEIGDAKVVYDKPKHPYSQALLSSVPNCNPGQKSNRILLQGELPSPLDPPHGCKFHTRCPYVMPRCKEETPVLKSVGTNQEVACHLY